jgi:hypothetical protein
MKDRRTRDRHEYCRGACPVCGECLTCGSCICDSEEPYASLVKGSSSRMNEGHATPEAA